MGHRGPHGGDEAEGRQGHAHHVEDYAHGQILADGAESFTPQANGLGQMQNVLGQEGHIGGLDGDIARPATFILDREGTIVWRDLTENWRVRVRPERLIEQLRALP